MGSVRMMKPRFKIAKYVPNLLRGEPRNIGVLLWTPHGMAARFVGESRTGHIDGRRLRSRFEHVDIYRRWVDFWRDQLSQEILDNNQTSTSVHMSDHEFLDAIPSGRQGNFYLVDGGRLLDHVEPSEIDHLVDWLFREYVALPEDLMVAEPMVSHDVRLDIAFERVAKQVNLEKDPHLLRKAPLSVTTKTGSRSFVANYAIQNGDLRAVFQRLNTKSIMESEPELLATAYMMEKVVDSHLLPPSKCGVLVGVPPEHMKEKKVKQALSFFNETAQVFNMATEQGNQELETLLLDIRQSLVHS